MEAKNIFTLLPLSPLAEIISYLETSDVFSSLVLVNKEFYNIVNSSPYVCRALFANLLGRQIPADWKLENNSIQDLLKQAFKDRENPIILPLYGFRGNGGCDDEKYEYLFDKVFEPRETRDPVCTKIGEDFEIEGVLSESFGKETRMIQFLGNIFNEINSPFAQAAKDLLAAFGLRSFQPFLHLVIQHFPPLAENNLFKEQLSKYNEEKESFIKYMQTKSNKYQIELAPNPMQGALSLIQSCEINRGGDSLTCPVKTLMVFASLNEEIGMNHPFVSLFNGCKTSGDLQRIYYEHWNVLPRINSTSSMKFASIANRFQGEESVEYVTFSSNGTMADVIPLFWIRFNNDTVRKFSLDLKDCKFSGRRVLLKLIECENLMERFGDDHEEPNIDLQSCCFYGQMLYF